MPLCSFAYCTLHLFSSHLSLMTSLSSPQLPRLSSKLSNRSCMLHPHAKRWHNCVRRSTCSVPTCSGFRFVIRLLRCLPPPPPSFLSTHTVFFLICTLNTHQMEEMLPEIRVKKSSRVDMTEALHSLKALFESLPSQPMREVRRNHK